MGLVILIAVILIIMVNNHMETFYVNLILNSMYPRREKRWKRLLAGT